MGAFEDFFTHTVGGGFRNFGEMIASGFNSGMNLAMATGTTVGAAIEGGAAVTIKSASGGFAYVVDFSKASAPATAAWTTSAAGDVRNFSIEAYEEVKAHAPEILKFILNALMALPPQLGAYDATARKVMTYVFGSSTVSSWERDAVANGYTMAFDLRGTASCTPVAATAFAGIYVDDTGQWGFFAQAGVGTTVALKPNMSISVDLWMIYGGRGRYAEKCYMPGLVASIKLPDGGALNLGGNVLVSQSGSFIGFRVTTGFSLIASNTPVAPDAGPTQTTLVNTTLAKRSPSYDAALRAARTPGSEGAVVATAMKAALPFVSKPGAFYYIQCKASGKVIEIPGGTHDDCEAQQYTWTGGANQRFRFDAAGDDSYYIVPQTAQTKVFDVKGGWTDQGVRVLQFARTGGDNQKWQVIVGKDGWFSLVARHSGQALDVGSGGMADGNPIQQWGWNGGDVQQFRFIEAMEQDRWRWCKRCSSLFHSGTPDAVCAAGGAHDSSGSGAYFPFVSPAGVDGALYQDHWRWCKRCAVLSFGGHVGKCAATGDQHDPALSSNYVVRTAGAKCTYSVQDNWRWCNRCQGLFYGGMGGVCAAGGQHTVGSGNYVLKVG